MKRLFYTIALLIMLMAIPSGTVEAKTTVATPKVEAKYNTSDHKWYYRFTCKTKGAKIKYKNGILEGEKYKKASVNRWRKIDEIYIKVYAYKGKNKSKSVEVDIEALVENTRSNDMHKVVDKYVDKDADDFTKLAQILYYFYHSKSYYWTYDLAGWCHEARYEPWYEKKGTCDTLSENLRYLCEQYGIKCLVVNSDDNVGYKYDTEHAWCHIYLDDKPIIIDPTCIVMAERLNNVSDLNKGVDVGESDRNKSLNPDGSKWNVLSSIFDNNVLYEKNKITIPHYDGGYTVLVYSEKDGYWTESMYDKNGIEAKWDEEVGQYDWDWYYGEEYIDVY